MKICQKQQEFLQISQLRKILLFFHACLLHKMDGKTRENVGENARNY